MKRSRWRSSVTASLPGVAFLLLAPLLAGCAATVKVGGYSMHQGRWLDDSGVIRARAAFEMKCAAEHLELVPIAVSNGEVYGIAQQIGVSGCDRRSVYVKLRGGGWVLNSAQ
jgi:hypothetical protein